MYLYLIILVLSLVALWHSRKPMPKGTDFCGAWRSTSQLRWLYDLTWRDTRGNTHHQQQIFDAAFQMIREAKQLVVLDMFLFNEFSGPHAQPPHRKLCEELTVELEQKKKHCSDVIIIVLTDPVNSRYGAFVPSHWQRLRAAGITVVETRLEVLRDSNPSWSTLWRLVLQWLARVPGGVWFPDPFGTGRTSLVTWLALPNFKANHRKTLVCDSPRGWLGLVASANAHDASSAHTNVALLFDGQAVADLLMTEIAVLRFSGFTAELPTPNPITHNDVKTRKLRVLTEKAILQAVLNLLSNAEATDRIAIAMFYLSHRRIIRALKKAARRGVDIRIILDPNKDAFGRRRNGIPNRQAAMELANAGITIRWAATEGEQAHSKLMLVTRPHSHSDLIVGSANFTRRNLDNYNLETCIQLRAHTSETGIAAATDFFECCWNNSPAQSTITLPLTHFKERSPLRYALYRVMEATGWSTF